MATSRRRLTPTRADASADVQLIPLPVGVARLMLSGRLRPAQAEGLQASKSRWHPQYPMLDSIDAIAMVFAAHRAMMGAVKESPAWWIHQIVVDGLVVGGTGVARARGGDAGLRVDRAAGVAGRCGYCRRRDRRWQCRLAGGAAS